MKTGAEQLRDWMTRRRVTQAEAAELLDCDHTFVSHLLSGRRAPGLTNAIRIERVTGISVEAWLSSALEDSIETIPAKARKSQ